MTGLNTVALADYLRSQGISKARDVHLIPLSGGQSNPTFILEDGLRKFVLRKKPPGQLIASAHAIDREYRVMQALQDSDVPVPRMLVYCEDEEIVGTPFYLMEFLEGRVLVDQSLPGWTSHDRTLLYEDLNRVIATLHSVDYSSVKLETFGKPGNYFARQIERWSRQIATSTVPVPSALRRLMDWLPQRIPAADDETTLIHGDYRLDNVIVHPTEPRIIGLLDWELSTLGHPLADFAYNAMSWRIPPTIWRGIAGLDLHSLGIPSEEAYLRRYADRTGRNPMAHWNFYLAFNFFRISAILHGITQRAAQGTAAAKDAVETGQNAGLLAELGWACGKRHDDSLAG